LVIPMEEKGKPNKRDKQAKTDDRLKR